MIPFLAVNIYDVEAMQRGVGTFLLYALAIAVVVVFADKYMSRFKWW